MPNHAPLTPLSFLMRTAAIYPDRMAVVHGRQRHTYRELLERCLRLASALAPARHWPGRHGGGDAAQYSGDAGGASRRADVRCRAQRPQHPPRRRRPGLHPRARRSQGADHRHRVRTGHARGVARRPAGRSLVIDVDDPEGPGRRADRYASTTRHLLAEGDPDFAPLLAGRRMAGDRAQLHLGHDRQPQGGGLPSSRRASERGRQRAGLEHAAVPDLSVDPADVPLQRLVLPLVDRAAGRGPGLPAPGRQRHDLRGPGRAWRHPSVRCADRHGHARQRARARPGGRSRRRCG